jgi:hypothetical protein
MDKFPSRGEALWATITTGKPRTCMRYITRIQFLSSLAGFLTISLFGFTLLTRNNIMNVGQEPVELLVCGTVAMDNHWAIENDPKASYGKMLFNANCKACHRLKTKLVGPALGNIYANRDSLRITRMIVNGNQLVKRKDKIAIKLYREYNNIQHTEFTSFKNEDVDALMHYSSSTRVSAVVR